ncbi:ETC complex I subunit conserved region-domain-containing protein [Microdochium trichocladiopsis]|uniref:ETC complex I subunit conserved region-domain-containing protein n=1 Tax=Microdochium trichocladiopsis TaxID=1682393 RepID=A0A9P8YCF8_9PEZI|nr:ETC complex I subunit conserved region-domain-containing protein [Microdochium trichocladiopsis]KAH7035499.1 ETC complex I subunit conserved region-domain-containing protein [Microdochium trichocladiopsis]
MRRTLRLLAGVKPARYLTPGNPTGLTGLYTHSSPRSSLIYLYSKTLDQLKEFPESSVYRQSIEALTKHRLSIIRAAVPPGYDEWAANAAKIIQENPEEFEVNAETTLDGVHASTVTAGGDVFLYRSDPTDEDPRDIEWDGEAPERGNQGLRAEQERYELGYLDAKSLEHPKKVEWTPEPQLTANQIEELETKIGAGLIEEVVQVAENELKLVEVMKENKVWESLEEKPPAGQWEYFERNSA